MPKNTKIFLLIIALAGVFMLGTFVSVSPNKPINIAPTQNTAQNTAGNVDHNSMAHITDLEAEAKNNSNDPQLWAELGNHYYDKQMHAEAVTAYENSLNIEPNNDNVRTDLGTMYREVKDYDKAIEAYAQVVKNNPAHKNARYNLGLVYIFDLNDLDNGVEAWQTLFNLYPDDKINNLPGDLFILNVLEQQAIKYTNDNDIDMAILYYNKYLSLDPRNEVILTDKADILEKNGRTKEAKEAWLELLKVNPGASTYAGQPVHTLEILQN